MLQKNFKIDRKFMASKSGNVFSDSCNGYVNILDPIPGTRTDNPILRETEDGLEGADCVLSGFPEDSVRGQFGNERIVVRDRIELLLDLYNGRTCGTDGERKAGIRFRYAGNFFGSVDIHGISVVIAYDIECAVTLLAEFCAAPL